MQIKNISDIHDEILAIIINLVSINFRLVNKKYKLLCDNYNLPNITFVFASAKILKYAIYNSYILKKKTFAYAAKMNNSIEYLNIMRCLKENRCPYDVKDLSFEVAYNGGLPNIIWLKNNICPLNKLIFTGAASSGNLNNMKWLFKNKCPWDECTFMDAAYNGNLNNMKWLFKNKCPWDADTFTDAAYHGNLDNMIWLFKNKCPWDIYTFEYAILNSNIDNMQWLKDNGCPWKENVIEYANENADIIALKWVKDNLQN